MKPLQKLSVGEYQELYSIHTSDGDITEKAILTISILTGTPRWEVEEMELQKFRDLSREINILFDGGGAIPRPRQYITVGGQRYKICLNPRKITAGQYVDLQHFLKGNIIEHLHQLMACLLVPRYRFGRTGKYNGENHEAISTAVKACNFSEVHATCVFFLMLWNNSIKALEPYLKKELMKKSPANQEAILMSLRNITDGSIIPQ